jgi:small conductance mechanosensitive channel
MNEQLATIEQTRATLIELAIGYGPRVLAALLILAAGWFAGGWIGRVLDGVLQRLELDVTLRILLVRIARVLVLLLFAIMALQNLGVELLPLIAGLGIAGAGVALALQGVLGNLAAGLSIIFTRPFKGGEYISIVGEEGRVEAISLFSTTLSHPDRSLVIIPNRKIAGEILHNYGSIRQLDLSVGIAYDTDIGAALAAAQEVLRQSPHVLADPAPVIQVASLEDSSIALGIRPWVAVADFGPARGELNRAIVETLRSRRIVIPFPQREVRILGGSA